MALELDARIANELNTTYTPLLDEGKLIPNEQFEKNYSTFRSRFGPDKLKNLDGEALLNLMYGSTDCLVYWLEFKDDDEFPSKIFGSISGGSSFKFGLFRRKETGVWTSGALSNPVDLSVEEAIELARRHRDQFIKGTELLESMPRRKSFAG
jgi:5-methylcytosine-specific restriction protein B